MPHKSGIIGASDLHSIVSYGMFSVCACVVLTLVFQSRRKSILQVPSGGLQHKQGNMAGHFFSIFLHVEYNPIQYGIECLDLLL
jgi:hypothetical protein